MSDHSFRPAFDHIAPTFSVRALIDGFAGRRREQEGEGQGAPRDASVSPRRSPEPPCAALDAMALRAQARAAYRSVDGTTERALDAALGVMEAEILDLRDAVLTYGETLKSIGVYAEDATSRAAARAALEARPQRLQAAPPVPRLSLDRQVGTRRNHG